MQKKFVVIMISVILLFQVVSVDITKATSLPSAKYTITVDNNTRTLKVTAEIPILRDPPIHLQVNWLPPGASIQINSYEGCAISEWTITKAMSDFCTINYTVNYDLYEIIKRYHKNPGVTEGFAAIGLENVLVNYQDILNKPAEIKIVLPEGWKLYSPIRPSESGVIVAPLIQLLRTNLVAGNVVYEHSKTIGTRVYNYVLFEKPKRAVYNKLIEQVPLITRDILLDADADKTLQEVVFYTKRLEKMFEYPAPDTFTVTGLAHITPNWRGFWHFDQDVRQDHIAHHIVHSWIPSVLGIQTFSRDPRRSLGLDEGFAMYYSFTLAYEYTKERRYLGHHYLYYLVYMRGGRKRLKDWSQDDKYIEQTKTYLYGHIITAYLDKQLNDVGKTLAEAYATAISRYGYGTIPFDDFLDVVERLGAKVDRDAIYNFDIDIYEYEKDKYFKDFNETVKFFVLNNEMPPTLFYAFIDIEANKGNPENVPYLSYPYLENWFVSNEYKEFINELKMEKGEISKEEFLKLLTKHAGGNDFFEFYSTHAPIKPSIDSVNCWLSGRYQRLVRKISYAMSLARKLKKFEVNVSSEEELINKAFDYLLNDKYDDANRTIIHALNDLYTLIKRDSDSDSIPDFVETNLGTDPTAIDTNDNSIPDALEDGMALDGFTWDWNKLYAEAPGNNGIQWVRAFRMNGTLWILIKLSKPAYEYVNTGLSIYLGDVRYPIFTKWAFWGQGFAYDMWFGNIFKYSMVVNDTIEVYIPDISFWEKFGIKTWPLRVVLQNDTDMEVVGLFDVPTHELKNATVIYGVGRVDKEYARLLKGAYNVSVRDDRASGAGDILILVGGPLANKLTKYYMVDLGILNPAVTNEWPGKYRGVIVGTVYHGKLIVVLAGSDRFGTKAAVQAFIKLGYVPKNPIIVEYTEEGPKIVS